MNIFRFYSLEETKDKDLVFEKLENLEDAGKISFIIEQENDIIDIEDLDLDLPETKSLIKFFEDKDVFPYLDREDDSDDGYFDTDFFEDDY